MNKNFLFLFSLACFAICLVFLDRYFFKLNDHFCLHRIYSTLPQRESWDPQKCSVLSPSEINDLFSQPFFYLGKGHQSFVFESQDKQFILKFYRFPSHLRPLSRLQLSFFKKSIERQKIEEYDITKLKETLASYELAFDQLKKESAVLLIHLHKTTDLCKKIVLVDSSKQIHVASLDKTHFLIQKKGELIFPTLHRYLDAHNTEQAKTVIDQIFSLILALFQKGIIDTDAILETNYGLMADQAFLIDLGRLKPDLSVKDPLVAKKMLMKITEPLKNWLTVQNPSLHAHYQELVDKTLNNFSSNQIN